MRTIFLDTQFVVALVNERDEHYTAARNLVPLLRASNIVTTGGVILEIGNSLARSHRDSAIDLIGVLLSRGDCSIEWASRSLVAESLDFYKKHDDKTWGLVDCMSFVVMRRYRIREALTNDQHFEQAGFVALMRD